MDLSTRRLYLCSPPRADAAEFLASVIEGGVDVVQLRATSGTDRDVLRAAETFRQVCARYGVPFVINDRPDLALAAGADGVHVGQDDVDVTTCRRILGPGAIVGLSTHAREELSLALSEDVTYLSAGPVEATPTKPGRPGTGLEYVGWATHKSPVPVFVTGGVRPESVEAMAASGVTHFVVVRYLTESPDPQGAARALRTAIDRALG